MNVIIAHWYTKHLDLEDSRKMHATFFLIDNKNAF